MPPKNELTAAQMDRLPIYAQDLIYGLQRQLRERDAMIDRLQNTEPTRVLQGYDPVRGRPEQYLPSDSLYRFLLTDNPQEEYRDYIDVRISRGESRPLRRGLYVNSGTSLMILPIASNTVYLALAESPSAEKGDT